VRLRRIATWTATTVLVGLAASTIGTGTASAGPRPLRVLDGATTAVDGSYLGVHALSPTDVWAVGYTTNGYWSTPLAVHYDGRTWHDVSPAPRNGDHFFNAVAGTSDTNVWAVGLGPGFLGGAGPSPLIEHWNGQSWTNAVMPKLPPGVEGGAIQSIDMVGPGLVWAVGSVWTAHSDRPAVWRRSAGHWTFVSLPDATAQRSLYAVSTRTATTGWAVGFTTPTQGPYRATGLKWDGHSWSRAAVVAPGRSSQLFGVDVVASGNAWAVGQWKSATGQTRGLIEHYTGSAWHQVSGPAVGQDVVYEGVSGDSPNDVWVVGYRVTSSSQEAELIHWNGSTWSVYHGAQPSHMLPEAVTTLGSSDAWAFGGVGRWGTTGRVFGERWNGHFWAAG
jgi:hypothetical protein